MSLTLGELATRFGCELSGDPDTAVASVATLANAGPGAISFFANRAYARALGQTQASAVIVREEDVAQCPVAVLISNNPYLTYARIANVLYPNDPLIAGVHESAVVDQSANISTSAQVSANAFVDRDCEVGDSVYIGPGVVVGPRCRIGSHTRLLANCTLVQDVAIGNRTIIHPGAVLGSDGFGNAVSDTGWVKVNQVGGVRIGDDVEIGANTTIDRGAIGDTVVENGVRLDNLIQIAHNVHIGEHTAMAAMTGISGSTIIGKRCMFAGQAGSVGHISICDDVVVGAGSYVSKDIREPGVYTGSFPAEKDKSWKRKAARFRRIDDIVKRISDLEKGAK